MQLIGGVLEQPMLGSIFRGSNHAAVIDMFRMNPFGPDCTPSKFTILEIIEKTGLSKNTTRNTVADLCEHGILVEDASHRMHRYSLDRSRLQRLAYLFDP